MRSFIRDSFIENNKNFISLFLALGCQNYVDNVDLILKFSNNLVKQVFLIH